MGIDRGVKVTAALSTGETLAVPRLRDREAARLLRLERKLARAKRGSGRRGRVKVQVARVKAREADRRKDWIEQASTDIARRFDVNAARNIAAGHAVNARGGDRVAGPVNREPQFTLLGV